MRRFLVVFSMMMFLGFSYANQVSKIDGNIEYKEIDKNTKLALVYDTEGNLIEKGTMINGLREGIWQGFDADGKLIAEVSFKNGKKDGVWKIYNNAELVYVLFYQEGKRLMAENLAIVQ